MTLKVFEMFTGYGGASFGLKKANIKFEVIGISEIDKYAIQCFNNNFPNTYNFGDCSKIKTSELPDFDLLTGGFPCQDVSIAGNRDLSKGRTNLYQEILRIAKDKKLKYILLENVKGLLSMKVDERSLVLKIVSDLQKIGYGVCWKVLNSRDYGIPQNRERIWFVCKFGGWNFMEFQFPNPIELKIKLKDILEIKPDKKYYLTEEQIKKIIKRNNKFNMKGTRLVPFNKETFTGLTCSENHNDLLISNSSPREFGFKDICPALLGRDYKEPKLVQYQNMLKTKTRSVEEGLCFAKVIANQEDTPIQIDLYHLQHGEIRPLSTYIPQNFDEHRCLQSGEPKEYLVEPSMGIRKLTPKECFRLMGFLNDEIILDGLSDTQKYKLAGNGWDINLVSKIFKEMLKCQ